MKKECPICLKDYTESQWRKAKGGYRAWRHFVDGVVTWCKGKPGQHFALWRITPVRP